MRQEVPLAVKVPKEIAKRLRTIAAREANSMSSVVRRLLSAALRNEQA